MADKIKLGLVGCCGMGTRHLYGLCELARTPFDNVELCALCDIRRENAVYAIFESSWAGRAVKMSEVESGQVYAYQEEIDAALGIE